MTHPTTWRGAVDRLPLMWVESAVLAVWSSWAGHWCVCSPHHTHTTFYNPKLVYTIESHMTAVIAYRLPLIVTIESILYIYNCPLLV